MALVNHFIRHLDSQMWHKVEDIAYRYPSSSRFLAFPIAIGTFIRDTLTTPAKCIEEAILTVNRIKYHVTTKEQPLTLIPLPIDVAWHFFRTICYMIMTPFSPLVGIVDAIVSFVKIGVSPFKTAKINASKQNYNFFLEQANYSNTKSYANGELINFANELEFAKAAWNRFKQQVSSAYNNEEIKNLHFLDNETSKRQIMKEVALKQLKFNEAQEIYTNNYMQLHKTHQDNEELCKNQVIKLNKAWKEFQRQLIKSSYTEASILLFTPTLN